MGTHIKIRSFNSPPHPHHICWFLLHSPGAHCSMFSSWLDRREETHWLYLQIILIRSSSLMGAKHRLFLTWREIPLEDISPPLALMTFSWRTGHPPIIVEPFPYHLHHHHPHDDPQPAESTPASQQSAPSPPFSFTFSIGTLRSKLSLEKVKKRNQCES